jgi:DnaJ homolog subfamily C member 19
MLLILFREGSRALGRAFLRTVSDMLFQSRMTATEARMILGVTCASRPGEVARAYERMYGANSRENKGSPYIQSKILLAYELLGKPNGKAWSSHGMN